MRKLHHSLRRWFGSLSLFGKQARKQRFPQRRRPMLEMLERREVFSASFIPWKLAPHSGNPVGNQDVMLVPSGESPVHFFLDARNTPQNDELGYFFTDGSDGRITIREGNDPSGLPLLDSQGHPQYVRPGDADYSQYALDPLNAATVFASGEVANHGHADKILDVPGDHYFGFFVVAGGSLDTWRAAPDGQKPNVWFSVDKSASSDQHDHFHLTRPDSPNYRGNVQQQYQVEDSRFVRQKNTGSRANFGDLIFSVNTVPFAYETDYTVYNSGADFSGSPQAFKADTPGDFKNNGLGLLFPDKSFNGRDLHVTDVKLYTDDAEWVPLTGKGSNAKVTVTDDYLHGTITVYANGGVAFVPDASDPYWQIAQSDDEPEPIYVQYNVTDGVDTTDNYVGIGHGFYRRGGAEDAKHDGKNLYLLAGGGDGTPFDDARSRFFTEGSQGHDIVLISQGLEDKEFTDEVFDFYAGGTARSVTSLNITTREQANDPRISKIIDGADVIWFGGGAQSIYQTTWAGTRLFGSLATAAASHVAIGGTSAGLAILGEFAYVEIPWDSITSQIASLEPLSERVHLVSGGLPFGALSNSPRAPLDNIITDTHFSSRDRMGRLITFTARPGGTPRNGLGVDEATAVLVEPSGNDWKWTVAGEGHAYFISPGAGVLTARYDDQLRLSYKQVDVLRLDAGTTSKLSAIRAAAPTYHIFVSHGTVFTTENGGQLY